eukprot:Tbor_TRINITY_DN5811_c4_g1::TRINITY_DN5811_c4_g1_i7::g.6956::m.6956
MAPPKIPSSVKSTSTNPPQQTGVEPATPTTRVKPTGAETATPTSRVAIVRTTGAETPSKRPPTPKSTPNRRLLSPRIPPQVPTYRPDSTHGSPSVCRGQFRPLRSNEVGHYRKDHKLGVPAFEDALKAAGIDINRKREKIQIASHRGDICYDDGLVCSRDGSPQQPYHYPPNETLPCSKTFPYTRSCIKPMNSPKRYESNANNAGSWPYHSYNNDHKIEPDVVKDSYTSHNYQSISRVNGNSGNYIPYIPYELYKKERKVSPKRHKDSYTSHNFQSTSRVNGNSGDYTSNI